MLRRSCQFFEMPEMFLLTSSKLPEEVETSDCSSVIPSKDNKMTPIEVTRGITEDLEVIDTVRHFAGIILFPPQDSERPRSGGYLTKKVHSSRWPHTCCSQMRVLCTMTLALSFSPSLEPRM